MGVDLTLMPLLAKDYWCAHELIRVERDRSLWGPIDALPQTDVPEPLHCYLAKHPHDGETSYGSIATTPYGDPIKYTTAGDLVGLKSEQGVRDNWKNRAVWAYLEQMPPEWQIALWWH